MCFHLIAFCVMFGVRSTPFCMECMGNAEMTQFLGLFLNLVFFQLKTLLFFPSRLAIEDGLSDQKIYLCISLSPSPVPSICTYMTPGGPNAFYVFLRYHRYCDFERGMQRLQCLAICLATALGKSLKKIAVEFWPICSKKKTFVIFPNIYYCYSCNKDINRHKCILN